MKYKIYLALLFTALPAAAVQKVTGQVDAVTIFTDRALVKRVQAVDGNEKTGTLRFAALPQSMVSDSVRASGKVSASLAWHCVMSKRLRATNGSTIRSRRRW